MISFLNDYSEGMHPAILEQLIQTNFEQTTGYGEDPYSISAATRIKEKLTAPEAEVYFISGGTQTNLIYISHMLRPYEAVISADTGHIYTHETGAIESTGHKVFPIRTNDGKITPAQVKEILDYHGGDEHMVEPKMVYISNPTELGTIYKKEELAALYTLCKQKNLYFYIDGARLAAALTAVENDVALSDYKNLCDAFYIGGTKCGALFGEALVMFHKAQTDHMRFSIKQKGALLAKGRMLGLQFDTLFQNDLYTTLGQHANEMALKLRDGLARQGYTFLVDSPTNQQFPMFPNRLIEVLEEKYLFSIWEKGEQESSIRLVTSWATKNENVAGFLRDIAEYSK
ncbi:MAG: threonine aldolase family protein [Christensenellaceae bacterium]|jgi:threonine aldolase